MRWNLGEGGGGAPEAGAQRTYARCPLPFAFAPRRLAAARGFAAHAPQPRRASVARRDALDSVAGNVSPPPVASAFGPAERLPQN
jgi:hypothetical protein